MKKAKQTKQSIFVLGEILTIGGIDYCNGYAVSHDVQYLLDYKNEVLGCGHFKIGVIIGRDVKMLWHGDVVEKVTPCMIVACNG